MIAGKYGWCLEKQLQAGGVEMLGKKTWNKAPLRNKQETVSGKIRTNTENIFEQLTEESPVSDNPPPTHTGISSMLAMQQAVILPQKTFTH